MILLALGQRGDHVDIITRTKMVDLLLEHKAEIVLEDLFVWVQSSGTSLADCPAILTKLLELTGLSLTAKNHRGEGLLQLSLRNRRERFTRHLLDREIPVARMAPFWFLKGPNSETSLFDKILGLSGLGIDDPEEGGVPANRTLITHALQSGKRTMALYLLTLHGARTTFRSIAAAVPQPLLHENGPSTIVMPIAAFD